MKTVKVLTLTCLMSIFCVGMTFAQQQGAQNQQGQQGQRHQVQQNQPGQPGQKHQGQKTMRAKATPEERASKYADKMKQDLNLNDDQASKVKALHTQYAKDQQQNRNANQQNMKAKKDAYDSQMKSILNSDQYQQYQSKYMKKSNDQKGNWNKNGNNNQGKGKAKSKGNWNGKGNWNKNQQNSPNSQNKQNNQ